MTPATQSTSALLCLVLTGQSFSCPFWQLLLGAGAGGAGGGGVRGGGALGGRRRCSDRCTPEGRGKHQGHLGPTGGEKHSTWRGEHPPIGSRRAALRGASIVGGRISLARLTWHGAALKGPSVQTVEVRNLIHVLPAFRTWVRWPFRRGTGRTSGRTSGMGRNEPRARAQRTRGTSAASHERSEPRAERATSGASHKRSELLTERAMHGKLWSSATKHTGNFGQDTSAIGHQAHGKFRPRHIRHRSPSTRETSAKTHRPSVAATKHTGNFGQDTSAIGHQAHAKLRSSATKHMGNFGQDTSAIGHQAHGKLRPRHIRHRSPSTRETSAKAHRPSVTKHTGSFGQATSAIGHQAHGKLRPRHIGHRPPSTRETSAIGHQAHEKLRPRHIGHRSYTGHRSPSTRETLAKAHRPLVTKHTANFGQDTSAIGHQAHGKLRPSATKHTGNFGQGTSAIGHQAHGKLWPSATKHTGNFRKEGPQRRHIGHRSPSTRERGVNPSTWETSAIGHQAHEKLRPRHIGHRSYISHLSPSTREASAKTHPPSVTKHTRNFGQDTSAIGHQAHGKLRPRHIGHRSPSTWETSAKAHRPSVTK